MIIQNTNANKGILPVRLVSDDAPNVVAGSKQAAPQQLSFTQLKTAVESINRVMLQSNLNLEFIVDSDTKKPIVKMVDAETGKLIRQIPSEEMLAITRSIDQFLNFQRGLLLSQKA